MHLDVAHENSNRHIHLISKKEKKMGLFVAICVVALTACCHQGAGVVAASTRGTENNAVLPNLFNDFESMQKLFEDQLQKIQEDHSKRLTLLETEMMKGCEQNDLNLGLIQRLTDQVTLLEGRLNETQNQNKDLRDEIKHLKKSESVLERPRREVYSALDNEGGNGVSVSPYFNPKPVVAFDAFRNQPFYEAQSTLTFNGTTVNIGGAFDPSNGQFVAPVAGVYSFSFHGLTYDGTATHIKIMKNGENMAGAYRRHEGEGDEEHESLKAGLKKAEGMLAQSVLLQLEPQDKVAVFAYHGNLRDGSWHYTHFTGHLLR